ncbi:MAG: alpha/beta hydrolase [Malacoplasma sp.]|nr:alpha/beta hydrolase [Malacoplasma sp.]
MSFLHTEKELNLEILEEKIIIPKFVSPDSKHIVFIHGFAVDSRCWELYVEKNQKNFLHLINLPGHGFGEYNFHDLSFRYMVSIVKKYLKSLLLKYEINLVAHSYGAAITIVAVNELVQENAANKLKKVILLAPYSRFSISKVIDKINLFKVKDSESFMNLQKVIFVNAKKTVYSLTKYLYEKLSLDFFRRNFKYFKWVILGMSLPSTFYKINDALKQVGPYCYFLFGEKDQLVNYEKTVYCASDDYTTPYVSVYKNCGHAFFIEKKETFFNEIESIVG